MDGGRFIEPEIIGIIKKRSGICKGENRVAYEKVWEDEKEVRIKLMTASVDGSKRLFWTKRLSVPFSENAFSEINCKESVYCRFLRESGRLPELLAHRSYALRQCCSLELVFAFESPIFSFAA